MMVVFYETAAYSTSIGYKTSTTSWILGLLASLLLTLVLANWMPPLNLCPKVLLLDCCSDILRELKKQVALGVKPESLVVVPFVGVKAAY